MAKDKGESIVDPEVHELKGTDDSPGIEKDRDPRRSMSKTLRVGRTYKDHGVVTNEEAEEELIEVRVPPEEVPLANVHYDVSMTLNTGDFESVKISCGIQLPTPVEEAAEAYKTAKAFVDKRLNKEVADVRAYRKKKAGIE